METDLVGDKIGRIHLGRQDLGDLQTRKMKGLKRGRADDAETNGAEMEEKDVISVDEGEEDKEGGVEVKRKKLS